MANITFVKYNKNIYAYFATINYVCKIKRIKYNNKILNKKILFPTMASLNGTYKMKFYENNKNKRVAQLKTSSGCTNLYYYLQITFPPKHCSKNTMWLKINNNDNIFNEIIDSSKIVFDIECSFFHKYYVDDDLD